MTAAADVPPMERLGETLSLRVLAAMDRMRLVQGVEPTTVVFSVAGALRLTRENGGSLPATLWGLTVRVDSVEAEATVFGAVSQEVE